MIVIKVRWTLLREADKELTKGLCENWNIVNIEIRKENLRNFLTIFLFRWFYE